MRLSEREFDDIRVATLLQDIDNIEVTARVIHRAVDDLQNSEDTEVNTFHGGDLLQSLGRVLTSALPLLACRDDGLDVSFSGEPQQRVEPIGAAIIRAVRRFDDLTTQDEEPFDPMEAIKSMRTELDGNYHSGVLTILEQIAENPSHAISGEMDSIENLICHSY
jgi:response regulator RpfG family c-di-GMP phosphodiesterase